MAIVLRSERNFNSSLINNSSVGPGQYKIQNYFDKNDALNQNNVPFNTSEERILFFENDTPGPGSYFKNNYNKSQFFGKKRETMKDHILNELPMYNMMNFRRRRKMNELKQLILDKKNKNQIQNLKYFNNDNVNYIEQKKTKIKLLQKKKDGKECSIPYNNQENVKGLIIEPIFQNKDKIKKEPLILDDKGKPFVKDIKMNNKELFPSDCSPNSSTNNYINKPTPLSDENTNIILSNISLISKGNKGIKTLKDNLILQRLKKKNNKLNSLYKNRFLNKIKDNSNINDLKKHFDIKDFESQLLHKFNLLKDEPGPGYYSPRVPLDKYQEISKENKKFNFGSNERRDILITKPRSKTNEKKEDFELIIENNNKQNKTAFPILSPSQLNIRNSITSNNIIRQLLNLNDEIEDINNTFTEYKNKKALNIGPGQYDIKSQFDNIKSKKYSFPLSKRFLIQREDLSPGPGTYNLIPNWNKINKNNIKKHNVKIQVFLNNKKPDVWSYNPHILKSIEYDNLINYSNIVNTKAPFGSTGERLMKKYNSTPDIVGPGIYGFNNNIIYKKKKRIRYKDKSEENERKKENIKILYKKALQLLKDKIGPGCYINRNKIYSDWYKKTFNSTYI